MITKIFLTHKGETHSIIEWADKLEINLGTLRRRVNLYRGDTEKILNPNLKVGRIKGCGSWNRKYPPNTRKEYTAWYDMHVRCYDKTARNYHRYGGRGILVCKRWEKFMNFLKDMGQCPLGMSLDRKNNDRGYYKNNCRWATKLQQDNNKCTNVRIEFRGKTQTVAEWSRELGVHWQNIMHRHKIGRDLDSSHGRWGTVPKVGRDGEETE